MGGSVFFSSPKSHHLHALAFTIGTVNGFNSSKNGSKYYKTRQNQNYVMWCQKKVMWELTQKNRKVTKSDEKVTKFWKRWLNQQKKWLNPRKKKWLNQPKKCLNFRKKMKNFNSPVEIQNGCHLGRFRLNTYLQGIILPWKVRNDNTSLDSDKKHHRCNSPTNRGGGSHP